MRPPEISPNRSARAALTAVLTGVLAPAATGRSTDPPPPMAAGRLPLLGHVVALSRHPLAFLDSLRAQGPVVRVAIGTKDVYVVTDPGVTHSVLVQRTDVFEKGGRFIEALRSFAGNGLATMDDGPKHRRQRRLIQPMFTRSYIASCGDALFDLVNTTTRRWPAGQPRDIVLDLEELTRSAFVTALFGAELDPSVREELHHLLPAVLAGAIRATVLPGPLARLPLPAQRRNLAALRRLRDLIDELIDTHRARRAAGDGLENADTGLLATFLDARDPDSGEPLTRREVQDEVSTFLSTSSVSTTAVLGIALKELTEHPETMDRLVAEIAGVRGGDRLLTHADLADLPYARQVIQETMRLHGPVWLLTRRVVTDTTLEGCSIPRGADLVFSPYIVQRDPAVYTDAARFDPDRWSPGRAPSVPRQSYIPFGTGSRGCVAESYAWVQMVILLCGIVSRWRLERVAGEPCRMVTSVTVHMDRLVVRPHAH